MRLETCGLLRMGYACIGAAWGAWGRVWDSVPPSQFRGKTPRSGLPGCDFKRPYGSSARAYRDDPRMFYIGMRFSIRSCPDVARDVDMLE